MTEDNDAKPVKQTVSDEEWESLMERPWDDPCLPWHQGDVPKSSLESLKAKIAWLRENPGPEKPDPIEIPFEDIPWEDPKTTGSVQDHDVRFAKLNEDLGVMVLVSEGKRVGVGSRIILFSQNREALQKFVWEKIQHEGGYVDTEGPMHEAYYTFWNLDGKTFWDKRKLRTYDSRKQSVANREIWAACGIEMGREWPDDTRKAEQVIKLVNLGILPEGIDNWLLVDKK